MHASISRRRQTRNQSVGVWHGPYEISLSEGSPKVCRPAPTSARVSSLAYEDKGAEARLMQCALRETKGDEYSEHNTRVCIQHLGPAAS